MLSSCSTYGCCFQNFQLFGNINSIKSVYLHCSFVQIPIILLVDLCIVILFSDQVFPEYVRGMRKHWCRKVQICESCVINYSRICRHLKFDIRIAKFFYRKALEKASKNQSIIDAIGEPIVRGPWYNASLAVTHKRHSVSCTFPVSGPQGTGSLQLRAVRNEGLYHPSLYFCFRVLYPSSSSTSSQTLNAYLPVRPCKHYGCVLIVLVSMKNALRFCFF